MLDNDNTGEDARPHRRTALIALELERYGVDIAALSETRLSGEGSIVEVGAGYTFSGRGTLKVNPVSTEWVSQFALSSWKRLPRCPLTLVRD